jgi:hypothetical protein
MSQISKPEHITMILYPHQYSDPLRGGSKYKAATYSLQVGRGKPSIGQRIKILDIHKERLGDLVTEGAKAEGHQSVEEYMKVWEQIINRWVPEQEVFVISLEPVP